MPETFDEAKWGSLRDQFKVEVHDKSDEIDPDQDWFSLTLGWALAKGCSPEDANDFAMQIRYRTDLG
jgi:hypothetical protein